MGAEEARLFSREGAKVVIGDVREAEGRQVEAEISERGGEALYLHLDVTNEDSWADAISTTVARFGKLDILVNNAGIGAAGLVENTTAADWDRVMEVNAKGVFLGTKTTIPALRQAGAVPSSTSRPSWESWAATTAAPTTKPPRARCACSPRTPPCSTPRTRFV